MKAHFIASTVDLSEDVESFRKIVAVLHGAGVKLTRNWLEAAYLRHEKSAEEFDESTWDDIYRENIDAIARAELVVAEISKKSFLVGFQVANALQMKKPILLLSKHANVDSALGVSLNEEIVQFSQYDEKTVKKIIQNFIELNKTGGKDIRFNFFIDRKLLNFLNFISFRTGNTKSQYIRQLLEKEMKKADFK